MNKVLKKTPKWSNAPGSLTPTDLGMGKHFKLSRSSKTKMAKGISNSLFTKSEEQKKIENAWPHLPYRSGGYSKTELKIPLIIGGLFCIFIILPLILHGHYLIWPFLLIGIIFFIIPYLVEFIKLSQKEDNNQK